MGTKKLVESECIQRGTVSRAKPQDFALMIDACSGFLGSIYLSGLSNALQGADEGKDLVKIGIRLLERRTTSCVLIRPGADKG